MAWDRFTTLHFRTLEGIVSGKSGTPGTAHVRLSSFKSLAVWALRKGLLDSGVVDDMRGFKFATKKAERAISEEAVIGIYHAVAEHGLPVHRALLATIAESGARVESLLGCPDWRQPVHHLLERSERRIASPALPLRGSSGGSRLVCRQPPPDAGPYEP